MVAAEIADGGPTQRQRIADHRVKGHGIGNASLN
jgi:hypothetical protein